MNLFFRLVGILLGHLLSRPTPVSVLSETNRDFRVWLTDQDALGHMTNSRYFSITDLAMLDFMLKTGALKIARRQRWLPIVAYEDCAFVRMLRFPEAYSVTTRLVGWTDRYICFEHVFVSKGAQCAVSTTLARFMTRSGRSVAIPDVAQAFGIDQPSPELSPATLAAIARLETTRQRNRELSER